jgi:hypothetical protein
MLVPAIMDARPTGCNRSPGTPAGWWKDRASGDIAPGRGRKPVYDIDKIAAVLDGTLRTKPAGFSELSPNLGNDEKYIFLAEEVVARSTEVAF